MLKIKWNWKNITVQVLFALVAGAVIGAVINLSGGTQVPFINNFFLNGVFEIGGQVFLRLLQFLVVPVVLVSLITGTAGLGDIQKLGRIGGKVVGFYIFTTPLAISAGLAMALWIKPGKGFDLKTSSTGFEGVDSPGIAQTFIQMFPRNPIESLANGEMLQIIFLAILFGVALILVGEPGKRILKATEDLNVVVMKIVELVIRISPVGVFCLMLQVFSEQGLSAIAPLSKYFMTIIMVLLFHLVVVYGGILKLIGRLNPIIFYKKFYEVAVFAFSTSSGNATIPVTMKVVEEKMGVSKSVSSFAVPLGATLNMDGTAIMQGVATVFVSQAYGIHLDWQQYLMVIFAATLATIGTAGVPAVGLIMLSLVFQQVGLPVEGIGIILAVDRLLDMSRTVVNVAGDSVASCIVSKSEGQFDEAVFYSEN